MAFNVSQQEIDDALQEDDARTAAGERPEADMQNPAGEAHLREYVTECVKESFEADKHRREFDEELWRAHENDMREYADKEAWQSKIVVNLPYTTAYQAQSIVRRGMIQRPDYFTIDANDPQDPIQQVAVDFWTHALKYWTANDYVRFQSEFADSAHFAFAVGQSQFMKLLWQPDEDAGADGNPLYGLRTKRFESWKQYADPDREPRRPQSGLYNVHEEFVDLYVLQELAAAGQYRNVEKITGETGASDSASTWRQQVAEQREEERRKSGASAQRNKFRKPILVREFWGTVLGDDGKLLYPNVSFTLAGNQIIRGPIVTPFPKTLRWPWIDFCPMPHPIKFHGYGLYEGVLAIWKLKNNLLNLYLDNENFRINQMYELDPSKLKYPGDTDVFPGKQWIRKVAMEANGGGAAVTPVSKGESNVQDVNFMWSIATQLWENGSFTTEFVKGEQSNRRDITATEVAQKTQQAMGVFDTIGNDCEEGAIQHMKAIHAFLQTFWFELDRPEFTSLLLRNPLAQQIQQGMMPDERMVAMALNQAKFKLTGVSRAFEKAQVIQQLQMAAQFGTNPIYGPYVKKYELTKRVFDNINEPDLVLSEQELQQQQEQERQMKIQQAIESATQSAREAGGLKDVNDHEQKAKALQKHPPPPKTGPAQPASMAGAPGPGAMPLGGGQ